MLKGCASRGSRAFKTVSAEALQAERSGRREPERASRHCAHHTSVRLTNASHSCLRHRCSEMNGAQALGARLQVYARLYVQCAAWRMPTRACSSMPNACQPSQGAPGSSAPQQAQLACTLVIDGRHACNGRAHARRPLLRPFARATSHACTERATTDAMRAQIHAELRGGLLHRLLHIVPAHILAELGGHAKLTGPRNAAQVASVPHDC